MGAKDDSLHVNLSPTAQLAQATDADITTDDGIEFQKSLQTNERLTPEDAHTTTDGLSACNMTNSGTRPFLTTVSCDSAIDYRLLPAVPPIMVEPIKRKHRLKNLRANHRELARKAQ